MDPPRLVGWPVPPQEPCPLPRYYPRPDSPLVGAGDPAWPDLGPDGLPREDGYSTIGAFGGPDADPELFVDLDDDGVVALLDCDDHDALRADGAFLWPDRDMDGLGDRSMPPRYECSGQDGWVDNARDCDDSDAALGVGQQLWPDLDQDGYGDRYAVAGYACLVPGWVGNDLDCDDAATYVGPTVERWPDVDGDGFGDASADAVLSCDPGPGWVRNAMDCDDSDPSAVRDCAVAWYGSRCSTGYSSISGLFLVVVMLLVRRKTGEGAGATRSS